MYFQCFVIYVLRGWYAFDWKAFLVIIIIHFLVISGVD